MHAGVVGCLDENEGTSHTYTKQHPLVYEDYWNLWPYAYLDEYGKPAGFNIELTEMILKKLGIPYIIKLKSVEDVLEDLKEQKADLMISVFREDRDTIASWGMENLSIYTQSVLMPKNGVKDIHTLTDIKHHPVTMSYTCLAYLESQKLGLLQHVNAVSDIKQAIMDHAQRNSGTIIWNTMSLKWLKRKYNLDNMVLIPLNAKSRECKFLGNDPKLIAMMDSVFASIPSAQQMQLTNKWFYPEKKTANLSNAIEYFLWALILLTLVLATLNRYYHVKNEKINGRFARMNQLLNIVVSTANIQVLVYSIIEGRFYLLDRRGKVTNSVSSIDYLDKYSFESGNNMRRAVYNIRDGHTDHSRLTIYSHPNEQGERRSYEVHMSRMPENNIFKDPLVFTIQDITEQANKEHDIRHALLQYHAAFDSSMADYVMFDKEGRMQEINGHFFSTFGIIDTVAFRALHVGIHDLPNMEFYDNTSTEDVRCTAKVYLDRLKADKRYCTINRSGILYWDILIRPVFGSENEIIGTIVTGRDITDIVNSYHRQQIIIKNEGMAIRESHDYVESINLSLQATSMSLIEYSPTNHTFLVQRSIWGHVIQIPQIRAMFMADSKELPAVTEYMKAMDLRNNQEVHVKLHICIQKGCQQRWMQFDFKPILNANKTVEKYAGTCRDISEMAEAESRLIEETKKAQETETLKNSFLSNMSYEIRTPLSAVVGFSDLLGKRHSESEDNLFISQIKENTNILLDLVNDILLLSRIDANMIEYKSEPTNIVPEIMERFNIVISKYRKTDVQYMLEHNYHKLVVDIDWAHLAIVFSYVLANAARYTAQGHCQCRYEYRHNELTISVEDSGIGMSKKLQEHAFDRFVHNEASTVVDSGLTLPICKEIITQLGGHIELESYQNRGTFIWISVPCRALEIERNSESSAINNTVNRSV